MKNTNQTNQPTNEKIKLTAALRMEVNRLGVDVFSLKVGDYLETAIGDFCVTGKNTNAALNAGAGYRPGVSFEQCTDAEGEPCTNGMNVTLYF